MRWVCLSSSRACACMCVHVRACRQGVHTYIHKYLHIHIYLCRKDSAAVQRCVEEGRQGERCVFFEQAWMWVELTYIIYIYSYIHIHLCREDSAAVQRCVEAECPTRQVTQQDTAGASSCLHLYTRPYLVCKCGIRAERHTPLPRL